MGKPANPVISPKASGREQGSEARKYPATAGDVLSPTAVEALADIVRRSSNLCRLQAERLKTDDGYQVIDPRTVATTFQEFVQTATVDPVPILKEQFKLWADLTLLWQKTATRFLFDTPVEPVIEPAKKDNGSRMKPGPRILYLTI